MSQTKDVVYIILGVPTPIAVQWGIMAFMGSAALSPTVSDVFFHFRMVVQIGVLSPKGKAPRMTYRKRTECGLTQNSNPA